ncbi:hypothetical protein E4195_28450 [Pseudomonas putida]|uniref:hypothetical protein n=1 Tax=Pseudomonas putida TaxID=303 RepID=UPI00107518E3|nr:hypothetical protein [Pseudomonas putida]TFW31638.1 hypothetical protein E4195_28450 [Pseudomonas putida]
MAGFNIKHWFADGAFRTIIRNSAWLGSSNVVSALLGLLALSCAGKGMTPAMFGVLVIFIAAFYLLCWSLIQRGRGLRS